MVGQNAATRAWEALPQHHSAVLLDPEPESDTLHETNLERAQEAARAAVSDYTEWRDRRLDHESTQKLTDNVLGDLRANIEKIRSNVDWFEPGARTADCDSIQAKAMKAVECVRAERALREIRPDWTLRAVLYGVGSNFPQLSEEGVYMTAQSYLAARDLASMPSDRSGEPREEPRFIDTN